jgi:hypothetical protein
MCIIHSIIGKRTLDVSKLNVFVSTIDGATYQDRGEGVFYYWMDGKSTRGLNITLEKDCIEVRNMVLSNRYDYELTNKVIEEILTLTGGTILDEGEEQITDFPIWDNEKIAETEIRDSEVILTLSKEHEVSIDGPIRKVHFGKRLHKNFEPLKGEQLKNKMFDLVLYVNYQIPNFEKGNIMRVGNSKDDQKTMKVLASDTNYIIDKYDYILLFVSEGQQPIMITNEILNTMLPSNWKLVDEYTVVAPITNEKEWDKLLTNAKKHDLFENFMNRKK